MAVRIALVITAAAGFGLLRVDRPLAVGILLGGLGGIVAFWLLAIRVEKLASLPKNRLKLVSVRWTLMGTVIYALVICRAYFLDPGTYHGLVGAVGGIFIIRIVLVFLGATGLDLKHKDGRKNGEHR